MNGLIHALEPRFGPEFKLAEYGSEQPEPSRLPPTPLQPKPQRFSGISDDSFDLTISIFGAMFAPRPFDVAKEMVRVTKPGGRIVMGNWIPGDPTLVAQILRISSAYSPPPPEGFVSPMTWGVEESVVERFIAVGIPGGNVSFEKVPYVFDFAGTPTEFVEMFRDYYGPTMNAFEAARQNGKENMLFAELAELFTAQNQSGEPGRTRIAATYLRVTVQKPSES
ncbi:class I SAM-dependent methyltransferase [Leptolyngbya sp. 7M]|nr:class I SAM-dependent methyltransferase [Leptolyngbya sp. 7M]